MSVDLFIWSLQKLPVGCSLLTENGYQDKGDFYERAEDDWAVRIFCEPIDGSEEVPDKVAQKVPGAAYLTEIIFKGEVPKEFIQNAFFEALAKELEGVLEDPQTGKLIGSEATKPPVSAPFKLSAPEGQSAHAASNATSASGIKTAHHAGHFQSGQVIAIMSVLGLLSVAMVAFIIVFSVAQPAGKSTGELLPIVIICSVILAACILLILYFVIPRKHKPVVEEIEAANAEKMKENMEAAARFDYDVYKRRFNFKDAKSDKFWHINRIDRYYYVHYGKNGSFGRIEIKESENAEACQEFCDKTVAEKLKKGYVEISGDAESDDFETHKAACRDTLNSMYFMFKDEVPVIYMAAVKAACEKFCDLLRKAAEKNEGVTECVKSLVLCLNRLTEETGIIETDEREMLYEFISGGIKLAGLETDEDVTEAWREW